MVTVDLRLACPLALKLNIHHTMVRRSIFNDPSPADSDSSKQETDSDEASDQVESDNGEELESPPPSELAQKESDDDDNTNDETRGDGDSEEEPNRLGDHEDTHTTIKPYVGLLASLDRDHNNSLSRHLHSAYLLRQQNLKPVVAPSTGSDSDSDSAESHRKTKRHKHKHAELVSDSEEDDDTYQFGRGRRFLTKQWTSWPHPPSYVPRETDPKISRLRNQPRMYHLDTYDQPLAPRKKPAASQMLEETLVATFLKFSGDKFRSRPVEETKGVTLALDDDVSQHVLKPVVRHVISQLDGLLKGLYHERGYARVLVAEDRESAARKSKYLQDKAKGVPWVERRKHKTTARSTTDTNTEDEDSAEERDPDNDDGEGTPPKKTQKAQKSKSTRRRRRRPAPAPVAEENCIKRHNRLRLRDWSQVLGVAALTGWEEDTLQRTVKRCEGRFDQTMSWRRLKESDSTKYVESGELWTGARLKHPRGEDEDNDGISKDGFMQPISTRTVYPGGARLILKGPNKKRVRVKQRA